MNFNKFVHSKIHYFSDFAVQVIALERTLEGAVASCARALGLFHIAGVCVPAACSDPRSRAAVVARVTVAGDTLMPLPGGPPG